MSYYEWVPASDLIERWAATDLVSATSTGTVAAALHAACYLCDCAIEAGVISYRDALHDRGLVHELTHHAAGDTAVPQSLAALAARAREWEAVLTNSTS